MNCKIADYNPTHAAGLAVMWNESKSAWPFGFGGPAEFTEQRVLEWMRDDNSLFILVAEAEDGRVIGFCEVVRYPKEADAAYVALLNVHPAFHGAKAGKTLLKTAVDRVVKQGFQRLDLHTWAANMKAVPLYKKCGFFWVPETTVYMQNYLPLIMQQAPARKYFAEHDWYETYIRELVVAEDDEQWEGASVFRYRWQDGADRLDVTIDRESRAVTALATRDWAVSCRVSDQKPAAGLPYKAFWSVESHQTDAVAYYLKAFSEPAGWVDLEQSGTLSGKVQHEAPVHVPADTSPRADDEGADRITTLAVIGSEAVSLASGLRVKQPVTVELFPAALPLYDGTPVSACIRLNNNLDCSISGELLITPGPGLQADFSDTGFSIPPHGKAGVNIALKPDAPGMRAMEVIPVCHMDGNTVRGRVEHLPVAFLEPGGSAAVVEEQYAVLETDMLRIVSDKRGGRTAIHDRESGLQIGALDVVRLGPPFWPSEFEAMTFQAKSEGSRYSITAESQDRPGIVIERTVSSAGGPIITLGHRVTNHGSESVQVSLLVAGYVPGQTTAATFPLREGLVRDDSVDGYFPLEDDFDRKPEVWAESWSCVENSGLAFGLIWPQAAAAEITMLGEIAVPLLQTPAIAPGQSYESPAVYAFAGEGDYRTVRRWWQRLAGKSGRSGDDASVRPIVEAGFDGPVLVNGNEGRATLSVTNPRRLELSGTLSCTFPDGWKAGEQSHAFEGVNAENPFRHDVVVSCQADRAGAGELVLDTGGIKTRRTFSCIRVGDGSDLRVVNGENNLWEVDNGHLSMAIDPTFNGSCYRLEVGGTNHLYSPYPEPGTFKAMKPWYGGIYPVYYVEYGRQAQLYRDPFTACRIERTGKNGWVWRGVQTSVTSRRKGTEGLVFSCDLLTLGGSNIMAVVAGVHNPYSAPMRLKAGAMCYLQPGGDNSQTVLHHETMWGRQTRTNESGYADGLGRWAAVENAVNGWTILGLAATGRFSWFNRPGIGAHLSMKDELAIGPGETVERLFYLVVLKDVREIDPYLALLDVPGLV